MSAPKSIAIIPARGGSKRIPGKNIKAFNGRPIITYSIDAALKASCFEEIMVSTDDNEIAAVARQAGAQVPFMRSAATSDDFATLAQACAEVLEQYAKLEKSFQIVCCILPTAPFVSAARLKQGYDLLVSNGVDAVVPVAAFSYPAQRALKVDDGGKLSMIWPQYYNSRSQDLPVSYHDAGQFYWIKTETLQKDLRFFADDSLPLILSQMEVQDIDCLEDWQLAELKYGMLT